MDSRVKGHCRFERFIQDSLPTKAAFGSQRSWLTNANAKLTLNFIHDVWISKKLNFKCLLGLEFQNKRNFTTCPGSEKNLSGKTFNSSRNVNAVYCDAFERFILKRILFSFFFFVPVQIATLQCCVGVKMECEKCFSLSKQTEWSRIDTQTREAISLRGIESIRTTECCWSSLMCCVTGRC